MDHHSRQLSSSPKNHSSPLVGANRRNHAVINAATDGLGNETEAVDADALTTALKDLEDSGKSRERTPGGSPSRKRQRVYGDRSVLLCRAF